MKRCRHDDVEGHAWWIQLYGQFDRHESGLTQALMRWRTCCICAETLPLGPSNDAGCEVEIRAAEIAAAGVMPVCVPGCSSSVLREGVGWEAHACGFDAMWCNGDPDCIAGYLARCIHEHKDEP